jgi:hypothetical protein
MKIVLTIAEALLLSLPASAQEPKPEVKDTVYLS